MPIKTYLMLRSARRARLEARTTSLQPDLANLLTASKAGVQSLPLA